MKSIHPHLFLVATFLNLAAIKTAALLLPDRFYFTFSSFLFDERSVLRLQSLVIKFALPFVVAFALAALIYQARIAQTALRGSAAMLDRLVDEQLDLTLTYAAFLSALLMAWPYILMWDLLIDPALAPQRLLFLIAYFIYFAGYALFARAGAEAAEAVMTRSAEWPPLTLATVADHPLMRPILSSIGAAFTAAVAAFLISGSK